MTTLCRYVVNETVHKVHSELKCKSNKGIINNTIKRLKKCNQKTFPIVYW